MSGAHTDAFRSPAQGQAGTGEGVSGQLRRGLFASSAPVLSLSAVLSRPCDCPAACDPPMASAQPCHACSGRTPRWASSPGDPSRSGGGGGGLMAGTYNTQGPQGLLGGQQVPEAGAALRTSGGTGHTLWAWQPFSALGAGPREHGDDSNKLSPAVSDRPSLHNATRTGT